MYTFPNQQEVMEKLKKKLSTPEKRGILKKTVQIHQV